jgi:hypothetical protein
MRARGDSASELGADAVPAELRLQALVDVERSALILRWLDEAKALLASDGVEPGEPLVTVDCHEVLLEWVRGPRRLVLYFGGDQVQYLTVAVGDLARDMREGELAAPRALLPLVQWLLHSPAISLPAPSSAR